MRSKKLFVFALFFGFLSIPSLAATCYYVPCDANIQMEKQKSEEEIKKAYDNLYASMDDLKDKYEDQLNALEEQVKLLEKYKELNKETLLKTEKILFLLKQGNKLQNTENSQAIIKD